MDAPRKRGLSALLAATTPPAQSAQAVQSGPQPAVLATPVPTAAVPPPAHRPSPAQPRTECEPDAMKDLADSIRARGLIQPLVVRQLKPEEISGGHRYEIIAGERRWRAAGMVGLSAVPV